MAMDQIYHIKCFTCHQCAINLQGKLFYALDGNPFCEDYLSILEKCCVCQKPILDRILRATDKPYPGCFCCVVCGKSLEGIPFTVDATNRVHCIEGFHKIFAPRCWVCKQPIIPEPGEEETVRVVALDDSFHIRCYICEDFGEWRIVVWFYLLKLNVGGVIHSMVMSCVRLVMPKGCKP
ncbi:lipoma-preferred partner homolog isoform X1 [Rhynchophorus ferrugineus]|uniref:lipoma-preferred partner homolog isoform X1 n=1 Tax=Rhynchophorus ferrugineus TaxID=354439 RepID=UPI003FCD32AD